jgi:uncharacterized delta-60 repeat protein
MTMRTRRHQTGRSALAAAGLAALALGAGTAGGAPADLDRTFNGNGRIVIELGFNEDVYGLALQPDGKAVAVGWTDSGKNAAVYRLTRNGSLDRTFDSDGAVSLDSGGEEVGYAVAAQPDGRIVVAGYTSVGQDAVVYRLRPNGAADPTFDGDGAVGLDSGGVEGAAAVAVQPDGKIVVAGYTSIDTNAVVYRLRPNGSPDLTFDGDGAVGLDSGGLEAGAAVALQPDGKIVVAVSTSVNDDAVVYRLHSDGSPDATFDGDGAVGLDSGGVEAGTAVAVQPDGKIVVAGYTSVGQNAVVYRLRPNGSPDPTFGRDGAVEIDGAGAAYGNALALQANGKILIAGSTTTDIAIAYRLRRDGSLDRGFGDNGARTISADRFEEATALKVQRDGRILLAGWRYAGSHYDGVVARLRGDRVPRCAGRLATIVGTARSERIRGTNGPDVIAGLGGRDVIRGLAGNDVVCGGPGRDTLNGGSGRDRLRGGPGRDLVRQ